MESGTGGGREGKGRGIASWLLEIDAPVGGIICLEFKTERLNLFAQVHRCGHAK